MPEKGFSTDKKCQELLPIEVLVFVNRWAKSDILCREDRYALYDIKDLKIKEWLNSGELQITGIIKRESECFRLIKQALVQKGSNLEWLDCINGFYNYLTEEESRYSQFLIDWICHEELFAEYPEDVEFQSTTNPDIIFHSPYNNFVAGDKIIQLELFPTHTSDREKFGRSINLEEEELYPIEELVKILGYSSGDFFGGLLSE